MLTEEEIQIRDLEQFKKMNYRALRKVYEGEFTKEVHLALEKNAYEGRA